MLGLQLSKCLTWQVYRQSSAIAVGRTRATSTRASIPWFIFLRTSHFYVGRYFCVKFDFLKYAHPNLRLSHDHSCSVLWLVAAVCWQFQNNRISDSASQKSPGVPYAQNSRPKSSPCNGNVRHNTRNILRKEIPVKILLMLEGLIWLSIFFHLDRTSISYVYKCDANDQLKSK